MIKVYNKSISANDLFDAGCLYQEIINSEITRALSSTSYSKDTGDVTIVFKDDLTAGDLVILDALVATHEGIPVPVEVEQVSIAQSDSDTGGISVTNKFAPDGWLQRLHEIEFTTATVGGAIHDKDYTNQDTGWSSVSFYENIAGVETLMESPTQSDLDTKCIRTDFSWMPDVDYMILSGVVSQLEIPSDEVYFWGMFLDVDPALNAYGIFPIEVLGGGMNMRYVESRDRVGLKGVSGSNVYYAGVMSPNGFVDLPPGLGTNRIRYIFRHPLGLNHRIQSIFEIFRP